MVPSQRNAAPIATLHVGFLQHPQCLLSLLHLLSCLETPLSPNLHPRAHPRWDPLMGFLPVPFKGCFVVSNRKRWCLAPFMIL